VNFSGGNFEVIEVGYIAVFNVYMYN